MLLKLGKRQIDGKTVPALKITIGWLSSDDRFGIAIERRPVLFVPSPHYTSIRYRVTVFAFPQINREWEQLRVGSFTATELRRVSRLYPGYVRSF